MVSDNSQPAPKPRIVVGPAPPRGPGAGLALALGLVLGAAAAGLTWWLAGGDAGSIAQGEQLREATQLIDELRRQLAVAERSRQVTDSANEQLRRELFSLDEQSASQREEVSFYQRLLEAGGSLRGLGIHQFKLRPTASPRVVEYRLVLTQNLKKADRVAGRYWLTVNGLQGDRATTLNTAMLGLTPEAGQFEFKYYQQLVGRLTLPEGFVPLDIVIIAISEKKGARQISKTFEWLVDQ